MTAVVETYELAPGYSISRVIRGGWQLAGGHGAIDRERAVDDLIAAFDAGVFTFDCADIYTGVEELYGAMRARLIATRGAESANCLRVHTKLVPDLSILRTIERRDVEAIIDRSLRRLKMERLDLVQFHWWDYAEPRWLDALRWLDDLRAKGKVRLIGGTNFDTSHVRAIIEAGIPLASMQVQYSVLDRRPENGLSALVPGSWRRAHLLRLGCRRLSLRPLARPAGAGGAAREPFAGQIQAHHRRFRRLDAISGASARAPPCRRPAELRHCERSEPVPARSSRRRCGHCRRDLARASCRQRRSRRARADRRGPGGDRGRREQSAGDRKATSTNSSATATGGTARS